jgi:capsular exopolysaccharide synthesis family protein
MSRIQNILEKAERDGSMRRVRAADPLVPVASDVLAAEAAALTASAAVAPPLDAIGTGAVPSIPPVRAIRGAMLDRRLVAAMAPDAAAAEQYRALRTRILHADTGAAVNIILVTSPARGDGKTLTAGNLGLTMAQDYQRRICVVDANLRRPHIHRLFGLPDGPGLAEVLAGQASLEEALVTLEDQDITLLPAGHAPARPAELLGTTAMRRTLDALRSQFDRVVIDAPATAPLADVGILTPLVDSVLLVVRAGITSKPAIHDAVASLDGSKLLGIVLNEAA